MVALLSLFAVLAAPGGRDELPFPVAWDHPSLATAVAVGEGKGSTVPLPPPVARMVRRLFRSVTVNDFLHGEWLITDSFRIDDPWYGRVYRFRGPGERFVYVYRLLDRSSVYDFFVMVYDPKARRVTHRPLRISGRWMREKHFEQASAGPVTGRVISFDDLDLDGRPEVVVQEVWHCGTECGSVIYRYLHVERDLSLSQIAARETCIPHRFCGGRRTFILREFEKLAPGKIRLVVRAGPGPEAHEHDEIGWVLFDSEGPGRPFVAGERKVIIKECAGLVEKLASVPWLLAPPKAFGDKQTVLH